jgi:hypothetical protein
MNKRIKELYAKANAWALHNYPPPVNPFEWEDLRSKKFAELIVRECIEHLEGNVAVPNIEHSRTKTKCIRSIKEHFGVEE